MSESTVSVQQVTESPIGETVQVGGVAHTVTDATPRQSVPNQTSDSTPERMMALAGLDKHTLSMLYEIEKARRFQEFQRQCFASAYGNSYKAKKKRKGL